MPKYKPGQSGNPAGRPKGATNKSLAMLKAIEEEFGGEDGHHRDNDANPQKSYKD